MQFKGADYQLGRQGFNQTKVITDTQYMTDHLICITVCLKPDQIMQKLSEWSKTSCCLWNIEWYQEEEEKEHQY